MYKKIAVLRANALGDFIFTLPALHALRKRFPDAEIVLLGRNLHRELLANRPSPVNRVVVIPDIPGVGKPEDFPADDKSINSFFSEMQKEEFDVAIQMHGGGRFSNPFIKRLGAALTIGSKTPDAIPLDISIPYTTYFNEVLRYLEIVSYLGAKVDEVTPILSVTPADFQEAEVLFHNPDNKPVALIQPGATDPRRWWPVEKFARVADHLVDQGFEVCFNGVEEERQLIRAITKRMKHAGKAHSFEVQVSLSALIGLVAKASIVISNDTGPLHIAHALNTPAVGLYWAPNMITSMPMQINNARPLVAWNTICPLCGAGFNQMKSGSNPCDHRVSFVDEISVEMVLSAIRELMQANSRFMYEMA